jgi:predicted esterase
VRARFLVALLVSLCVLVASSAAAEPREHEVAEGQTLGGIARRYNVTIAALCNANGITRRAVIRPGQRLVIPDRSDRDGSAAAQEASARADEAKTSPPGGLQRLAVAGGGTVYYYEPTGPGRFTLRPVLVYLHGRGGNPERDCQRWAKVARPLGWLVCPAGPVEHNSGRSWNNNWLLAQRTATATVQALRAKYGRRVQLYGNTLIGFSEGAFAAMNVGVRDPRTFNRWLILAANDDYFGGPGVGELAAAKNKLRRVYLITGERDGVIEGTRRTRELLRQHGVTTRITTPSDLGHEVALEARPELYRMALVWLQDGEAQPAGRRSVAGAAAVGGGSG